MCLLLATGELLKLQHAKDKTDSREVWSVKSREGYWPKCLGTVAECIRLKKTEDEELNTFFLSPHRGQGSIWYQGCYSCWYVKPIYPGKTNCENICSSVDILIPRSRRLRQRDPWAMQLNLLAPELFF